MGARVTHLLQERNDCQTVTNFSLEMFKMRRRYRLFCSQFKMILCNLKLTAEQPLSPPHLKHLKRKIGDWTVWQSFQKYHSLSVSACHAWLARGLVLRLFHTIGFALVEEWTPLDKHFSWLTHRCKSLMDSCAVLGSGWLMVVNEKLVPRVERKIALSVAARDTAIEW